MATKMRPMQRNFSGEFSAQEITRGVWRLAQSQSQGIEIFIRGADYKAGQVLDGKRLRTLGIEWSRDGAMLRLLAGGQPAIVEASNLVVHEPLERLYDALPLAAFDAKAQRFWSRVFAIARLPGGRLLLGWIARSGRRQS